MVALVAWKAHRSLRSKVPGPTPSKVASGILKKGVSTEELDERVGMVDCRFVEFVYYLVLEQKGFFGRCG